MVMVLCETRSNGNEPITLRVDPAGKLTLEKVKVSTPPT
jgi:hypothetical protein